MPVLRSGRHVCAAVPNRANKGIPVRPLALCGGSLINSSLWCIGKSRILRRRSTGCQTQSTGPCCRGSAGTLSRALGIAPAVFPRQLCFQQLPFPPVLIPQKAMAEAILKVWSTWRGGGMDCQKLRQQECKNLEKAWQ